MRPAERLEAAEVRKNVVNGWNNVEQTEYLGLPATIMMRALRV